MPSLRVALLVAVLAAALVPALRGTAAAATCDDYPDQAAAQRAADTRDADGDGIYCESLPCPCLKPGKGGGSPAKRRHAPAKPRLGPSVTFGPVRRRTGCHVRGALPDRDCTPGARFRYVTRSQVCRTGYTQRVRNVSERTKRAVYAAYGVGTEFDGTTGEVDHVVSLELGGSNSRANLFPEAASPPPGAHEKDRLENALHQEVCDGAITLRHAQRLIATDWLAAYRARFGDQTVGSTARGRARAPVSRR